MNGKALVLYLVSVAVTLGLYLTGTVPFTAGTVELMVTAWLGGYTARILAESLP